MKQLIITVTFCFISTYSFAQKENVRDEVEDSFEYAKKSFSYANDALAEIKQCYDADNLDDILYYAGRAKSEIEDAMSYAKKAEYEADDAEDEASYMECYEAEDEADDAEEYFKKAKNEFDDAYSKLSSASYEDDLDYLSDYLSNAVSYIEDGITYLKKAVEELEDTLEGLDYCN